TVLVEECQPCHRRNENKRLIAAEGELGANRKVGLREYFGATEIAQSVDNSRIEVKQRDHCCHGSTRLCCGEGRELSCVTASPLRLVCSIEFEDMRTIRWQATLDRLSIKRKGLERKIE